MVYKDRHSVGGKYYIWEVSIGKEAEMVCFGVGFKSWN